MEDPVRPYTASTGEVDSDPHHYRCTGRTAHHTTVRHDTPPLFTPEDSHDDTTEPINYQHANVAASPTPAGRTAFPPAPRHGGSKPEAPIGAVSAFVSVRPYSPESSGAFAAMSTEVSVSSAAEGSTTPTAKAKAKYGRFVTGATDEPDPTLEHSAVWSLRETVGFDEMPMSDFVSHDDPPRRLGGPAPWRPLSSNEFSTPLGEESDLGTTPVIDSLATTVQQPHGEQPQ
jgi:hypothetical protein